MNWMIQFTLGVFALPIAVVLSQQMEGKSRLHHQFYHTTKQYGFADEPLESGSHIVQVEDHVFHVYGPNDTTAQPSRVHKYDQKYQSERLQTTSDNPGNQWIAWYEKTQLGAAMGFNLFSSYMEVPQLPKAKSNIAIFNSLQASYDPTSYNYILQPVISTGAWMSGTFYNQWTLSAVMCPSSGSCLFSSPIKTSPGNIIYGTIRQLSGSPNSYKFEVNITDLTAKTATQTITYSTKYFAPWALVSLEHNPAGKLKSCDELPQSANISFTKNQLTPMSMDMWQGTLSDNSCGISVDTFVSSDSSPLNIKL